MPERTMFILLVDLSIFVHIIYAQQDSISKVYPFPASKFNIELGAEYLWPVESNRKIHTTSFNALLGKEFFKKIHLSPYGGITATYAWGQIVQLNEFLQEVIYDNAAFGIGPVFLLRFEPLVYKGFSLGVDASGGIIFYTNNFPAGGDLYNFMWRIGPMVAMRVNNKYSINMAYRWMHVSNGQGIGQHNPYYPAQGISINFDRYF